MRINLYSQELILIDPGNPAIELVEKRSNTGIVYSGVRQFLYSSDRLHHTNDDDDRSAVTWWMPQDKIKRERLALMFEAMAKLVREAPAEGLPYTDSFDRGAVGAKWDAKTHGQGWH